jgi:hypothetical protein
VRRAITVALVVLVSAAACGSKKKSAQHDEPTPGSGSGSAVAAGSGSGSGSGSATVLGPIKTPALRWTTPAGDQLLALSTDGKIDGPCGPVGMVTATDVLVGGQTFVWTGVDRKGRRYQISPLPWTIEIADSGDVSLTQSGKPATPLGKVTGTETEDGAKWFAALVIAAPTLQIKLAFTSTDLSANLALMGSADLDAWTIQLGGQQLARKERGKPRGALLPTEIADGVEPAAITVTPLVPSGFEIKLAKPSTAYRATAYAVSEMDDGALLWKPNGGTATYPLGTLTGRAHCKLHDQAVAALLESYLASKAGVAATRGDEQNWFGKPK